MYIGCEPKHVFSSKLLFGGWSLARTIEFELNLSIYPDFAVRARKRLLVVDIFWPFNLGPSVFETWESYTYMYIYICLYDIFHQWCFAVNLVKIPVWRLTRVIFFKLIYIYIFVHILFYIYIYTKVICTHVLH